MAQKKRRSKQDKVREKADTIFVGREEPIERFRRHLESSPDDDGFIDIFSVYGQGGVGKTYLVNKLMGMAKSKNALVAYTDEGVSSVVDWMGTIAKQLAEQSAPLKKFTERYEKYLQQKQKLEADPEAPKGWIAFLAKTAIKGGLAAAKGIPYAGGFVDLVDKDAAADQASELATYLYSKWKNKDEVQLVLEPEVVLTPLFFDDLYEYEEDRHIAFFIDTYEETSRFMDQWLRAVMNGKHGDVPVNMTWVISGREKLNANDWSAFASVVRHAPLEPFTDQEAKDYLDMRGITNQSVRDSILKLSLNFPVYLAMLADGAPDDPGSVQNASEDIVDRFLKWIDDPIKRKLALEGSLPRYLNKDIVKRLLPQDADPESLFEWLCRRPFVQKRAGEWTYHPVVREIMIKHLRKRSIEEWDLLNTSIAWYFEERATALGFIERDEQFRDTDWKEFMLEFHYHKLLINPKKSMPDAIRAFTTAHRLDWTSGARPWGEMIDQAEQIIDALQWGKTLINGLDNFDYILQMNNSIFASGWLTDQNDSSHFHNVCGVWYSWKGQYDKAIECYQKAIEIKPDNHEAWDNMGTTYDDLKQYDKAIECYQKAIEIKPDDPDSWHSLGWTYLLLHDLQNSYTYLQKAWKLSEQKSDTASQNLGHIHLLRSDQPTALSWYRKSLPLWDDIEDFFAEMESDYINLKMADHGVARKAYDKIIKTLREEAEKLSE